MFQRALASAAFVLLFGSGAFAATHQITQSGLTWVPNEISIEVGDTVEWIYTAGSHTVTHGTDDSNPPLDQKLFDEPLTSGASLVTYTFLDAGDVPFYCRPHRTLGMTGVIHVNQPTPAPEPDGPRAWGRVKSYYR